MNPMFFWIAFQCFDWRLLELPWEGLYELAFFVTLM